MRLASILVAFALCAGCARGGGDRLPPPDAGEAPKMDAGTRDAGRVDREDAGACVAPRTSCPAGCVDTSADRAHCGGCGLACPGEQLCVSGVCSDGCVAPRSTECAGACVDVQTDRAHCGGCGAACDGGKVCVEGSCVEACPAGTTDCGDRCADTATDPAHCGSCGAACPSGLCAGGTCGCPSGQIVCDGACVDPASSAERCGASGDCAGASAGARCAGSEVCAGGACTLDCPAGATRCGSGASVRCADLTRDPAHCGSCGGACSGAFNASATCTGSTCGLACNGSFLDCDSTPGCETDGSSDPDHCGACATACPVGQRCASGACVASPELCANGIDDDRDGALDCMDTDCASSPSCGGGLCSGLTTLSAASGTITDGSPGDYQNSMSCSWRVQVPGATGIQLDFSSFELEGCCDYVTVYEGTSSSGRQLGRYNGTTLPPSAFAAGDAMFLTFTTDSSVVYDGFTASYVARTTPLESCANGTDDDADGAVDCADTDCASSEACAPVPCSGVRDRSAPTGVIQDGSGPSANYRPSSDCGWRVQVPGAAAMQLDFREFALEGCCDYVTVYEGNSTSGRQLGRFNGTTLPPRLVATGDAMYVRFTSDSSVERAGFVADYQARSTPPESCTNGVDDDADGASDCADSDCSAHEACTPVQCSGAVSRSAPTGRIQDGSPGDYPSNVSCAWTIDVPGATSIGLTFSSFALEGCCDYVTVYQGTSASGTQLGRFNGTSLPPMVSATGSAMHVTFTSDFSVEYDGFVADYVAGF